MIVRENLTLEDYAPFEVDNKVRLGIIPPGLHFHKNHKKLSQSFLAREDAVFSKEGALNFESLCIMLATNICDEKVMK